MYVDEFNPSNYTIADSVAAGPVAAKREIIPGFLWEGLHLLAAPSGSGKSWLLLDLAIGLSTGTTALAGTLVTPQCAVLNYALEDDRTTITSRMAAINDNRIPLEGTQALTIRHTIAELTVGGYEEIEEWCANDYRAGLVIIDIYDKARGAANQNKLGEGKLLYPLKRIADRHHVAIIIVVHPRSGKINPDEPTAGLWQGQLGPVDDRYVMNNARTEYRALYLDGRNVENQVLSLRFISRGQLTLETPVTAGDSSTPETNTYVVQRYLTAFGASSVTDIANALGLSASNVSTILGRLRDAGITIRLGATHSLAPVVPIKAPMTAFDRLEALLAAREPSALDTVIASLDAQIT